MVSMVAVEQGAVPRAIVTNKAVVMRGSIVSHLQWSVGTSKTRPRKPANETGPGKDPTSHGPIAVWVDGRR